MILSDCGKTVRRHDPDRFLLSLFAPADRREALWALYAFNYEIARAREVVTETRLGLIRLQWWRDAVESGAESGHPVLSPLRRAIARHGLPLELFERLVYAREFDLEDRQPATLEGTVKYAELTHAPLLRLSLLVLGEEAPDGADRIAAAYALAGILRATPGHLRQRRCYLPADTTPFMAEVYEGRALEKLRPVAEAVAGEARRILCARPEGGSRWLKLHAALSRMYLAQMEKAGHDLFHPRLSLPPFARELRLWWAAR